MKFFGHFTGNLLEKQVDISKPLLILATYKAWHIELRNPVCLTKMSMDYYFPLETIKLSNITVGISICIILYIYIIS